MKYVVLLLLCACASLVHADEIDDLIDELSAPAAIDRANAQAKLTGMNEPKVSRRLEKRWKDAAESERLIILNIATSWKDPHFIEEIEDWIEDERLSHYAFPYLRALSTKDLTVGDEDWLPGVLTYRAIYALTYRAMLYAEDDNLPDLSEILRMPYAVAACFNLIQAKELRGAVDAIQDAAQDLHQKSAAALQGSRLTNDSLTKTLKAYTFHVEDAARYKALAELVGYVVCIAIQGVGEAGMAPPGVEHLEAIYSRFRATPMDATFRVYASEARVQEEFLIALYRHGKTEYMKSYMRAQTDAAKAIMDGPPQWPLVPNYLYSALRRGNGFLRVGDYTEAEKYYDDVQDIIDFEDRRARANFQVFRSVHMMAALYSARVKAGLRKYEESIASLNVAVSHGFSSFEDLLHDPSMERLLFTSEFDKWMDKHASPSAYDKFRDIVTGKDEVKEKDPEGS